jgi:hypothetical protein
VPDHLGRELLVIERARPLLALGAAKEVEDLGMALRDLNGHVFALPILRLQRLLGHARCAVLEQLHEL